MKRLLSTLLLLAALIAPSLVYGQTPTLVQSFVSAGNPVGIGDNNGNGYIFTLPNAVLAGDALVMSLSVPDGITVSSITDNEGNSWPLTESLSVGVRRHRDDNDKTERIDGWSLFPRRRVEQHCYIKSRQWHVQQCQCNSIKFISVLWVIHSW